MPVGPGVLGQIVVDDQHVLALLHKRLAHGASGVRCNELQRRGVGGTGVDHDGMVHGAVLFQYAHHLRHLALLLADGHVDADQIRFALVDDGVDGNGGLAGGAVADDQLALAAADGDHGIDGLDPGLNRGVHGFSHHYVGSRAFHRHGAVGGHRAFAVQRAAQRVNHASDQGVANRHLDDLACRLDPVAFFDRVGIAENRRAHDIRFQVEGEAQHVVSEIEQLVGPDALQALNAGDTVTYLQDGANVDEGEVTAKLLDLTPDERYDLLSPDCHRRVSYCLRRLGRLRADRLAEAFQGGACAAVQQLVADLDDQPAQDRFIHLGAHHHFLAHHASDEIRDAVQFCLFQRNGGGHLDTLASQAFVQQARVGFLHISHGIHAAPADQQRYEVADHGVGFG